MKASNSRISIDISWGGFPWLLLPPVTDSAIQKPFRFFKNWRYRTGSKPPA
jgi:hypothetical protein